MASDRIELQLKNDQIFGLHVCVPKSDFDRLSEFLQEFEVEFYCDSLSATRLDEPDRRTVLFSDSLPDLRAAFDDEESPVRLHPEIVTLPPRYEAPFAALLTIGRPKPRSRGDESDRAGFGPEHVPGLLRVFSDPELHGGSSDGDTVWAPIHALRVLGALRAEAAIAPALEQLRRIDDDHDDYLGGEVAGALARIGPAAVAPAAAYLASESHGFYARLAAARALAEIAAKWPEVRPACVDALVRQLGCYPVQSPDFNGLLVSALLDVPAPEAAPAIERAFAANRVDETIAGDWEDVQIEFGLKHAREHPRKPNALMEMGTQLREAFGLPELDEDSPAGPGSLEKLRTPGMPFRAPPKVGRNDPCPCGSGKKYKKCCGA